MTEAHKVMTPEEYATKRLTAAVVKRWRSRFPNNSYAWPGAPDSFASEAVAAVLSALHCAPSPTPEQVARVLARFDWPYAPENEREAWVEKHWRDHLPKADAVLTLDRPTDGTDDA